MKRVFFRYFLSVFSIAVLVLLVQFGMLVFQYRVSQDKWKSRVYEDFAVSAKEAMSQGFYDGYGINSLLLAFSSIDEDRVSGFLLRDVDGYSMFAFGKNSEGRLLTSMVPTGPRAQSEQQFRTVKGKATRINVVYDESLASGNTQVTMASADEIDVKLPQMLRGQDIIGSIIIAINGTDSFIVDLLSYSPRTYEYSKDIINSCFRALLLSVPVCLLIALVAAWIVSSRNTRYINSVRKALNDLSRGKSGVTIPRQDNIELNEISVAIEDLDRSLQSNAKSRKAWLSSISHDLNTPATAMKIIVDGLNDGVFPADSQTLQQLQKENDSLSDRIGRVIDFSSLQSDTSASAMEIPTEQLVSDVLSSFGDATCIKIDIQCDSIRCDAELMAKAVRELLKNAVEYGTGEEQVIWKVFGTDDSYSMEVINEGHLASDMDADFFEPWSRGDWSRTSGGSGLGLPIAATIMQLHNGSISITQADENHVKASVKWPK